MHCVDSSRQGDAGVLTLEALAAKYSEALARESEQRRDCVGGLRRKQTGGNAANAMHGMHDMGEFFPCGIPG